MEGMEIPADGLIIEGDNIFVDERALTEEIEPILKTNLKKCRGNSEITSNIIASPIIYSGTKVFSGEGKFLVLVVGADSRIINKMRSTFMRKEETILQKKIGFLKSRVWGSNLILSILILLVLIIRFMVERIQQNNFLKENLKELAHYFLIAVNF